MQKVLLAIDGIHPDHKVFDYAVQLCKRIKAELKPGPMKFMLPDGRVLTANDEPRRLREWVAG